MSNPSQNQNQLLESEEDIGIRYTPSLEEIEAMKKILREKRESNPTKRMVDLAPTQPQKIYRYLPGDIGGDGAY